MPAALIVLILIAVIYGFLNGSRDSSSIVATMISSRSMPPRLAMGITAAAEFTGPLLFGVAVANTIGRDLAQEDAFNLAVLLAALVSAITWNLLASRLGIPSSSSHALVGGLVGAVIQSAGVQAVRPAGLGKVGFALFFSPVIGLVTGFLLTRLLFWIVRDASPRINGFFKYTQVLTAAVLASSHGANDAQKTMGIITLGLVISGYQPEFHVPWWVVLISAGAIAAGATIGDWRLIRTVGGKFYRIRPVDAFSTQTTSALVILTASLLGGPVSTTQVASSTIMGVGAASRISKVRWGVAVDIVAAWLITIPATGLLSAGLYGLISKIV